MNPTDFPEANAKFRAPPDLTEQQVMTVSGYCGPAAGGSLDGAQLCVTCWKPTEEEVELIKRGQPIFLSFLGGLPPHFPCMSFKEAVRPA
jgi:hypothetical protein